MDNDEEIWKTRSENVSLVWEISLFLEKMFDFVAMTDLEFF